MVEACERRILEFPLAMGEREVAKELKREGWYAWASDYATIIARIKRACSKLAIQSTYAALVEGDTENAQDRKCASMPLLAPDQDAVDN
jgi:lambda repressor-like predicted transcriptional regulator